MPKWRNGRRDGLKHRWGQPRVGSTPTFGTISFDWDALWALPPILNRRIAPTLPGGAAVAQRTLDPLTQVRILAGQPTRFQGRAGRFAIASDDDSGQPKALVTGGAGFIGAHLVERLLDSGYNVTVVDNLSSAASPEDATNDSSLRRIDIADRTLADIFAESRPDVVFHLAAQISVTRSMRDPDADVHANVVGGINVLQQCARFGVRRIVLFSTGGALYGEPEYVPCDESHPIRPLSVYGASKFALEHYTRIIAEANGIDYTILRPGNVYGPGQDPHGEAGVVAIFALRMLAGQDITIYGDGQQDRDLFYVSDVVDAAMAAARPDAPSSGTFNVASGGPTSVNDIFSLLAEETGYDRAPVYAPERPGEVRRIYLDIRRARQELGWEPRVELREGIARTVAALRGQMAERPKAGSTTD